MGSLDILFNVATLIIIPILAAITGYYFQHRISTEQSRQTGEKIAKAESKLEAQPEKSKPAWDLARATLEQYFNRNLSQITAIFWLSVCVMLIGFGIIAWGIIWEIYRAFHPQINQPQGMLGPAAIASLSGVITEFIGASFLFIYRSTIHQAVNYSMTLERINSVGMAMQILDTIPEEPKSDDLKSKTKATLVELLIKQSYEASIKYQVGNKDNKE
jgi:hypothetical protein